MSQVRMGIRWRLFTGVVLVLSLLAASLTLLVLYYSEPSCKNDLLDMIPSPQGRSYAFVFSRNCGATTGENIQVSELESKLLPEKEGNIVIMDKSPKYSKNFEPEWKGEDTLTIKIPEGARIFKRIKSIGQIKIEYENIQN